jgi:hypothetical protein
MQKSLSLKMETGLLAHYAGMRYQYSYAIGEYIDNSIQSYMMHRSALRKAEGRDYRLQIDLNLERHPAPAIEIRDNAAGIYEADVERAFSLGMRPPDRSGLSQYGLGMKSASVWFSRLFTVETCALGEPLSRTVTFDVDFIAESNPDSVPIQEARTSMDEHFTRIRLEKLRRPLPGGEKKGSTLESVRHHLRMMYREFLRAGDVVIRIDGEELTYQEPPLLVSAYWPNKNGPDDGPEREWREDISFGVSAGSDDPEKKIQVHGWLGILARGDTKNAGIALIWKKKVIVPGQDFRPTEVFGSGNTFASQRLTGQIDVSNLNVTSFKDAVSWEGTQEEEFLQELRAATRRGTQPFYSMLNNVRVDKTAASPEEVEKSILDATKFLEGIAESGRQPESLAGSDVVPGPIEVAFEEGIDFPARHGSIHLTFRVIRQESGPWLQVENDDDRRWVVSVNHEHVFMRHYLNLPQISPQSIYHTACIIASAIIDLHESQAAGFMQRALDVIEGEARRLSHSWFAAEERA